MSVKELRAFLKERHVRGYSTMNKKELEKQVREIEEKEVYEQNLAVCSACLEQQRIQRKIDEKMYNQRLLEELKRKLACKYCQHDTLIIDGDMTVCGDCGVVQDPGFGVDYVKRNRR